VAQNGKVDREEMYQVFNMGIGMAVIVARKTQSDREAAARSHDRPHRERLGVTRARVLTRRSAASSRRVTTRNQRPSLPRMEKRRLGKQTWRSRFSASAGLRSGTKEPPRNRRESAEQRARCRLNVIDTAECYESSEELIGKTGESSARSVLSLHQVRTPAGVGSEGLVDRLHLESIERSLRRLQTDRVDLVQLHSAPRRC
jgi:hypothetical protein